MTGPLNHIRVLDLTRVLAGPWGTQLIGDMGAEVIKIERPKTGDDTRGWGPPFLKDADGNETGESAYFLSANRAKKSVTVDLASKEGQDLIRQLAAKSDILVENYKVGTLARYGLGYEDIKTINPRLIYCSVTGFGQSGPYAPLPGYDFVFQGMSGLMSLTGLPDDQPGGGPMKSGIAISDILTGMYSGVAVLAALEHRRLTGQGQHIDLALLDCVVGLTSYQALNYLLSGKTPGRWGNAHSVMVPYQAFPCQDGHVIVAVGNDTQFASLSAVLGRPDLACDPRFIKATGRVRHRDVLVPIISDILLSRPMAEWIDRMEAANVPCGPIYTMPQVFEDPQVKHRQMLLSLDHPAGVSVPNLANPIRFSETPITYREPAPMLGQHTEDVLRDVLGLDSEQIKTLRAQSVI